MSKISEVQDNGQNRFIPMTTNDKLGQDEVDEAKFAAEPRAWPGDERNLDDNDRTREEQREIKGLNEKPIPAADVEIWESEQDWGDK